MWSRWLAYTAVQAPAVGARRTAILLYDRPYQRANWVS